MGIDELSKEELDVILESWRKDIKIINHDANIKVIKIK
tara:strand:+ start:4004 stop:4117 length:114 start_codon:yes stop_codon:yes gene_type:complete